MLLTKPYMKARKNNGVLWEPTNGWMDTGINTSEEVASGEVAIDVTPDATSAIPAGTTIRIGTEPMAVTATGNTITVVRKHAVTHSSGVDIYKSNQSCVLWLLGQNDAHSATIRDRSGNGNHGTITGATWKQTGAGLWYLDFDGSANKVVVGSVADFKWLHGAEDTSDFKFTIKLWMFVTSFADDLWGLIDTGNASSAGIGVSLWVDNRSGTSTRALKGLIANGGAGIAAPTSEDNAYPDDASWHHFVWTHDQSPANTNSIIYLDTVFKATANKLAQTPSTSNPVRALNIGRVADNWSQYGGIALPMIVKNVAWTQGQVTNNRNQERHLFRV